MTTETADDSLLRAQEARISRALTEGREMTWERTASGWQVSTPSGGTYLVTREGCNCPDHVYRCAGTLRRCKHVLALALHLVREGML